MSAAASFIYGLTVAHAHRWDAERLYLILTAYLDESGTHGPAPIMVMGGAMGTAGQWTRFESDFDRIRRKHGFRVLHTRTIKSDPLKFFSIGSDVTNALMASIKDGVAFHLNKSDFEEKYRSGEKPRRLRLDTAYGLCLRTCLLHFILQAIRRYGQHKAFEQTELHVIMESGHKHVGDADRVFKEMRDELRSLGSGILGSLTFAGKESCGALMAADFISHTAYLTADARHSGQLAPRDPSRYPDTGPGITHVEVADGGYATLKQDLILSMNARRQRGQATLVDGEHSSEVEE